MTGEAFEPSWSGGSCPAARMASTTLPPNGEAACDSFDSHPRKVMRKDAPPPTARDDNAANADTGPPAKVEGGDYVGGARVPSCGGDGGDGGGGGGGGGSNSVRSNGGGERCDDGGATVQALEAGASTTVTAARDFRVLTTFSFKHGVIETPVRAKTVRELADALYAAMSLPTAQFDFKVVDGRGRLFPLLEEEFAALGVLIVHTVEDTAGPAIATHS